MQTRCLLPWHKVLYLARAAFIGNKLSNGKQTGDRKRILIVLSAGTPIVCESDSLIAHIDTHAHTHTHTQLKTTLKHVFKLDGDIPVTPSRHRPVLCSEEGSSRVYFYTRSLTPTYISSQLLVRTEDTSTWVVIISGPRHGQLGWRKRRGEREKHREMRWDEMRRED